MWNEKVYREGSSVSLMAHSCDGAEEIYGLHTVHVNQTHCLLHLSRGNECFLWPFFPTVRQGVGKSLSPFAQVKLVQCVPSGEGGNILPAYKVHQTPELNGDQHRACGDSFVSRWPCFKGGVIARLAQSSLFLVSFIMF